MSKFVRIELKDKNFFYGVYHILGQLPVTIFLVFQKMSLYILRRTEHFSIQRSASYLQTSMFLDFTREDRATSGYM